MSTSRSSQRAEQPDVPDTGSGRWKINDDAKAVLEQEFLRKRFPSPRSKKRLAEELDVEPRRIQVWFQKLIGRHAPKMFVKADDAPICFPESP